MTKKIFAMFLAVLMVVSALPIATMAAEETCPGKGATHTKHNCTYTLVKVTAPTCLEGFSTYKCNTCGDGFTADFTDPTNEHTWVDAEDVAPTCEKPGSTGGKKCSVCGKIEDATVVPAIFDDDRKCDFGAWEPANIDCTVGGTQTRTCKFCGAVEKRTVAKVEGGHALGAWELKTPATAEANGLAVRKCTNANCPYTEEQEVFFSHDHNDKVMIKVEAVAVECKKDGTKEHFVCRICGQKFVKEGTGYKAASDAALAIPSLHSELLKKVNCVTTSVKCDKCGEYVTGDAAAHKYDVYTVVVAPTCLSDGLKTSTCSVCKIATSTQIIPKLGHRLNTITVPATCSQYEYTFSYCVNPDCPFPVQSTSTVKVNNKDVEFDLKVDATLKVAELELSRPLFSQAATNGSSVAEGGMIVKIVRTDLGKTLYMTFADGQFGTTEEIEKATKIYLEKPYEVTSGKEAGYMYVMNGTERVYIGVTGTYNLVSGTLEEIKNGTENTQLWSWNEALGLLTTMAQNGTNADGTTKFEEVTICSFGTKTSDDVSIIKVTNITHDDFVAGKRATTKLVITNAEGVKLVGNVTVDVAGGFNPENHAWDFVDGSYTPPTCTATGAEAYHCLQCKKLRVDILPMLKDHVWVKDESKTDEPATCTKGGTSYLKCKFYDQCHKTKKENVPALGHKASDAGLQTYKGSHTETLVYDYYVCATCGEVFGKCNFRAWPGVGKIWDSVDAAKDAVDGHGNVELERDAKRDLPATCTTDGYDAYICPVCKMSVFVKVASTGHKAPEGMFPFTHANGTTYDKPYQAPTCTEDGWSINYKCTVCGQLVDSKKLDKELTILPATGHTWKEFTAQERKDGGWGNYVPAPCDQPVYDNYTHYCSVCFEKAPKKSEINDTNKGSLKADTELVELKTTDGQLCVPGTVVYEIYKCHCGKTHARNFLVAGKNVNHNFVSATVVNAEQMGNDTVLKQAATCTAEGFEWVVCTFCGTYHKNIIAKLPHKNAAGQTFYGYCNDAAEITDRHCVLCCTCKDKKDHNCVNNTVDGKPAPCACVIGKDHLWDVKEYMPSVCGDMPHWRMVCNLCYESKAYDETKYVKGQNAKGEDILADITGLGHRPEMLKANEDKHGGIVYVPNYKYISYVWNADHKVVQQVMTYTAKFISYTAPTYTTEGSASFVCADCGKTFENVVLPALSGLNFKLNIVNGNNLPDFKEYTYGSLVEVTVTADAKNVDIYGFDFDIVVGEGAVLVGDEQINDNFIIETTDPAKVQNNTVNVSGHACNDISGKMQNVAIGENTAMVKLLFRVTTKNAKEISFTLKQREGQDIAEVVDVASQTTTAYDCGLNSDKIATRTFLDFNNDGAFVAKDLYLGMSLLTDEQPDGKTYDVTLDVNKDGELTLEELTMAYNYLVGNLTAEELLAIGLTEEELVLLNLNERVLCNNSACKKEISADAVYCPFCGNHQ